MNHPRLLLEVPFSCGTKMTICQLDLCMPLLIRLEPGPEGHQMRHHVFVEVQYNHVFQACHRMRCCISTEVDYRVRGLGIQLFSQNTSDY